MNEHRALPPSRTDSEPGARRAGSRRDLLPLLAALAVATLLAAWPRFESMFDGPSWVGILRFGLALLALGILASRALDRLGAELADGERALAVLALSAGGIAVVAAVLGSIGALRAPVFAGVLLAALSGEAVLGRPARAWADRPGRADLARRTAAALAVAMAVMLIADDLHRKRYEPPGAAFYDDVSYHLPASATWLRYADLRMLRVEVGDRSTAFYPVSGEWMSWFATALSGGGDFFARWSQLPAALGLLLLVWALTKRAGGSDGGAALAVALALSITRLFPDATLSAGNDVWAAFWLCAALLFMLRLADGMRLADTLLLGVALGGLVGVKYLGLLWLPVLAAAGLVAGAARQLPDLSRRQLAGGASAALGFAIATGGFSYLRNLWTLGNPVFPAPVRIFGYELFAGWSATGLAAREGQIWTGIGRLGAFLEHPELLGPIWSSLFLPGLIALPVAAVAMLVQKRDSATRALAAITAVLVLQVVVYTLWIPDRRDIRYVLAAPLLAGVVLSALLSRLPARWRIPLWFGGGAWALVGALGSRPQWLTLALVLGLAAGAVVFLAPRWRPSSGLAVLGLVAASLALAPTVSRYLTVRDRFEPAARALATLTAGAPAAVAYVGGNRPYFYYGTRLQNRVEVVPTQGPPANRFYDFAHWDARDPYEGRRPGKWFANLEALGIEYILIEARGLESRQASWLQQPRYGWHLAASGPGFEIWAR